MNPERGLQLLCKGDEQFSPCTGANKNVGPFYKQQKSQKATRFHGIIYAEKIIKSFMAQRKPTSLSSAPRQVNLVCPHSASCLDNFNHEYSDLKCLLCKHKKQFWIWHNNLQEVLLRAFISSWYLI